MISKKIHFFNKKNFKSPFYIQKRTMLSRVANASRAVASRNTSCCTRFPPRIPRKANDEDQKREYATQAEYEKSSKDSGSEWIKVNKGPGAGHFGVKEIGNDTVYHLLTHCRNFFDSDKKKVIEQHVADTVDLKGKSMLDKNQGTQNITKALPTPPGDPQEIFSKPSSEEIEKADIKNIERVLWRRSQEKEHPEAIKQFEKNCQKIKTSAKMTKEKKKELYDKEIDALPRTRKNPEQDILIDVTETKKK